MAFKSFLAPEMGIGLTACSPAPAARFAAKVFAPGWASKAETEIAKLWIPPIRMGNRQGAPTFVERRLRIYPDGTIETITRTTATYSSPIDVNHFPFDRQNLSFEIRVREETLEYVNLNYIQKDLDYSRPAKSVALDGWEIGLLSLDRSVIKGWNGDRYARVTATALVDL